MSNTSITYLVAVFAGVFGLAAFVGLILAPVWASYAKVWERLAAGMLSLYVLVALIGIGAALGAGVVWVYTNYG